MTKNEMATFTRDVLSQYPVNCGSGRQHVLHPTDYSYGILLRVFPPSRLSVKQETRGLQQGRQGLQYDERRQKHDGQGLQHDGR